MPEDFPEPESAIQSVTAAALHEQLERGEAVRILDVRNRDEVDAWTIDGPNVSVTAIPFMKFLQANVKNSVDDLAEEIAGTGQITVVCAKGEASAYVASQLDLAGYDARNLGDGMNGWARLYDARELEPADGVTIRQYHRPSSGCLSYLVASDGESAVIDPLRAFVDRYLEDAEDQDLEITTVIDTHVHADHVSGLRELAAEADGTPRMRQAVIDRGVTFDVSPIADGETIEIGSTALQTIPAPGHTTGMTAFAVDDVLLTGDSLFLDSVARPDLEDGVEGAPDAARTLYATLHERFAQFDDATSVAPGHVSPETRVGPDESYTASLGALRRDLSAFEMDEDGFVDYLVADMPPRPDNFERIIQINLGREAAADAEAFELELGPNNCAAGFADAG